LSKKGCTIVVRSETDKQAILGKGSAARVKLINRTVMLSEALQRNAKHEARLSNIEICFQGIGSEIIRDSSPATSGSE
jgi:hypothetical protein